MKTEQYIGIDYGNGQSNVDKETGIRFGVISQYQVIQAWCDSSEPDYGKPEETECPECGNCFTVSDQEWGDSIDCPDCGKPVEIELPLMSEPIGFFYDDDGYKLSSCLDTDIMVIKSPYFTYGQFCSPCVPGAVNLETPIANGPKGYCLGHDWFESGQAPYPVYSVETGELVEPQTN